MYSSLMLSNLNEAIKLYNPKPPSQFPADEHLEDYNDYFRIDKSLLPSMKEFSAVVAKQKTTLSIIRQTQDFSTTNPISARANKKIVSLLDDCNMFLIPARSAIKNSNFYVFKKLENGPSQHTFLNKSTKFTQSGMISTIFVVYKCKNSRTFERLKTFEQTSTTFENSQAGE
uniref:Uncharacterized protein n=1 Tax=Romanomermis culicivorax TaxID=13658 RepID=A0A915JPT0_ROMCU